MLVSQHADVRAPSHTTFGYALPSAVRGFVQRVGELSPDTITTGDERAGRDVNNFGYDDSLLSGVCTADG